MDRVDLDNRFTYHPPRDALDVERYQEVRGRAKELAFFFNTACPDSRELSTAITKLEEAVFWANASIARHGSGE